MIDFVVSNFVEKYSVLFVYRLYCVGFYPLHIFWLCHTI
jgi:hypothetical protein